MSLRRRSGGQSSSGSTEVEEDTKSNGRASSIYTEDELERKYGKPKEDEHWTEKVKRTARKTFSCSGSKAKKILFRKIPILDWLPKYNIRRDLISDIVAGITVGVVHLPQGMAYADLASQRPVNGLYVSFFPVIMFMLLGTCRHVSMGTYAVVSIMVGTAITDRTSSLAVCSSGTSSSSSGTTAQTFTGTATSPLATTTDGTIGYGFTTTGSYQEDNADLCQDIKLRYGIALAMANGLIQILMSIFRLGIVTTYLSSHLISAFTCGAAFHVLTSQVPKLLGLDIPEASGPAALIYDYIAIFSQIGETNWETVIVSLCCIVFLVIGKEINLRYHDELPIAIPWELGIVIFSTVASYCIDLESVGVPIVGDIPTGLNTSVPDFSLVGEVIPDAIAIAIVAFTTEISLATLFSEKHSYKIDPDQELVALGVGNVVGSFFNCFPAGTSLSRSVIWEEAGARTQLTGAFSSFLILCILLWIAPLFESMPKAALASIIVVNLKGMLRKFEKLPPLWRVSKIDATIWIITWLAVFLLGVSVGLAVGVIYEIFTVVLRAQITNGSIVEEIESTRIYVPPQDYRTQDRGDTIILFKYPTSLMFANKVRFQNQISLALGFDPSLALKKDKPKKKKKSKKNTITPDDSVTVKNENFPEENNNETDEEKDEKLTLEEAYMKQIPGIKEVHDPTANGSIIIGNVDLENPIHDEKYDTSDDELEVDTELSNGFHEIPKEMPPLQNTDGNDANETPNGDVIISAIAYPDRKVSHLILDLSCCPYIDNDGALMIKKIHGMMTKLDITVYIASSKSDIRAALHQTYGGPKYPVCYISNDAALKAAKQDLVERQFKNRVDETTSL